ncbi:7TM diverse intracellular signalling [Hathewaya proteolytica DSM 3090]|uniref:7TM diverse intracellular signalling n=1 Tax=Hathewaya proteolytica DSM 3090 TaxID=1121331 RepID=A0A1M6SWZ6_9CLOT|nr:histidine kinase [Hathewaya proteolytica]SHK49170.1 7TM diverse intracellular signalling [Hathewaya proteolytica DSM 3090]
MRVFYRILLMFTSIGLFIGISSAIYLSSSIKVGKAVGGRLEISNEVLDSNVITLDGQWEFYAKQIENVEPMGKQCIDVPGNFSKAFPLDGKNMNEGYGTYRLKIVVPRSEQYGLKISFLSSAYEVLVDGRVLRKNGVLGKSSLEELASWEPQHIFLYMEKGVHHIAIKVSNFTCYQGGIINSLIFGLQEKVYRYEFVNTMRSMLYIGILIGISFYLVVINMAMKRKNLSTCLFIFSLSALVLELHLDGEILFYLYPRLSVTLSITIEYLSYVVQLISVVYFIYFMYTDYFKRGTLYTLSGINIVYFFLLIFTPTNGVVYHDFLLIMVLVVNYLVLSLVIFKAIKNHRKSAFIMLLGNAFLILGGVLQLMDLRLLFKEKNMVHNDFYILGLILYVLCLSYVFFFEVENTYDKANKAKKMEIAFLQAQIAPHFFFNVINNIYYMMDSNVDLAKKLLISFSDFLRVKHKFDYRKTVFYTLREELELVNAFVDIENVRLNKQIELEVNVGKDLLDTYILPLLIQPLVENSIKHGFTGKPLKIYIKILKEDRNVIYEISDNGRGMGYSRIHQVISENISVNGIGLSNINYRLKESYSTQLQIYSVLEEGTSISFTLPI